MSCWGRALYFLYICICGVEWMLNTYLSTDHLNYLRVEAYKLWAKMLPSNPSSSFWLVGWLVGFELSPATIPCKWQGVVGLSLQVFPWRGEQKQSFCPECFWSWVVAYLALTPHFPFSIKTKKKCFCTERKQRLGVLRCPETSSLTPEPTIFGITWLLPLIFHSTMKEGRITVANVFQRRRCSSTAAALTRTERMGGWLPTTSKNAKEPRPVLET